MKKLTVLFSLLILKTSYSQEVKEYTVGVEGIEFLPYSEGSSKKYDGKFKKILENFAKETNIKFIFKPLPISRLYADFYSQKLDFKIPANPYWQKSIKDKKNYKVHYSMPVLSYLDGLIVKNTSLKFNDLKKIGIISGFTPSKEYQNRILNKKLVTKENPSIKGLLQQTALERIDGAYVNVAVGKYILKHKLNNKGNLKFAKDLPFIKDYYYMATIKHSDLLKKFNEFLNGPYKKSLKKLQDEIDSHYR